MARVSISIALEFHEYLKLEKIAECRGASPLMLIKSLITKFIKEENDT